MTSTMTCMDPKEPLNSWMLPGSIRRQASTTKAIAVLETVCPAASKFKFDVSGREFSDPGGQTVHTVRYPDAHGQTTVTCANTSRTPLSGIPPRPVTCTGTAANGDTHPGICRPSRESAIRDGPVVTTAPATSGVAAATEVAAAGPGAGDAMAEADCPIAIRTATTAARTANLRDELIGRYRIGTPKAADDKAHVPGASSTPDGTAPPDATPPPAPTLEG